MTPDVYVDLFESDSDAVAEFELTLHGLRNGLMCGFGCDDELRLLPSSGLMLVLVWTGGNIVGKLGPVNSVLTTGRSCVRS